MNMMAEAFELPVGMTKLEVAWMTNLRHATRAIPNKVVNTGSRTGLL